MTVYDALDTNDKLFAVHQLVITSTEVLQHANDHAPLVASFMEDIAVASDLLRRVQLLAEAVNYGQVDPVAGLAALRVTMSAIAWGMPSREVDELEFAAGPDLIMDAAIIGINAVRGTDD